MMGKVWGVVVEELQMGLENIFLGKWFSRK